MISIEYSSGCPECAGACKESGGTKIGAPAGEHGFIVYQSLLSLLSGVYVTLYRHAREEIND